MSSAFPRPCKSCHEQVFLTSKHLLIRDEPGYGQQYLCWECWTEICASAVIGYEIRAVKGEVTRLKR